MRRPLHVLLLAAMVLALLPLQVALGNSASAAPEEETAPRFKALVFSKVNGFEHESRPYGVAALQKLATENNFEVVASDDAANFTDETLAQYDVVVFNNTNSRNGPILDANQRAAFERYIQAGGGYMGIHSASGTEYDWAWYGELMGAFFKVHPAIQDVEVEVDDRVHPSTKDLPQVFTRNEEPYDFVANPRGNVHVLASFDSNSYNGDTMGADHPISWCQNYDGGRSWYTGMGHNPSAYSEPLFLKHLLGGIEWSAGAVPGDCGPTDEERFEKVLLDGDTDDPLDIDIADDGRVFYVQRGGAVKFYDPEHQHTHEIAKLDVLVQHTHGIHGITLDPNFSENNFLYIYYSPLNATVSKVSRFTFKPDTETLDLASEKVLLEINSQRQVNAHEGGGMDFDPQGNLYVATGDNSLPCCSGFGATDERPGHEFEDAQGSSANTNDLRGKILRIHPEADGTYTIPDGNLFAPGTEKTRPEIYVMGLRNPYRIHVDPETGYVHWGEVGPDARVDSETRGPKGYDEFNIAKQAGNFGWPHCIGYNRAYIDYDYATGESKAPYDCAGGPVNDSPNNTGLTKLPPVQPAWIAYPYDTPPDWPELGSGGRLALQGPTYHYDPNLQSETKFPEYYDDTDFIAEWTRNTIFEVRKDEVDPGGKPAILNRLWPHGTFLRPIDMEFGPDGSLYLVEWGSNYGGSGRGDPNFDSGIYKINYVRPGERSPVAKATATPTSGQPPLTVKFSSEGSADPDAGQTITYAWDFDGDGTTDSTEPNPTHVYSARGDINARLTVTDPTGRTGVRNLPITVGNTAPKVELTAPLDGQVFTLGEPVPFDARVTDAEDGDSAQGQIDCTKVVTQPALGHDQHGHPLDLYSGCKGTIQSIEDSGHDHNDNIFYIVDTKYTDKGAEGVKQLTGGDSAILQPRLKQAEFYSTNKGVVVHNTDEPDNGRMIGTIDHGDNVSFEPVNLKGVTELRFRVASAGKGGRIEVRTDAADGPLLATVPVEPTGGWRTFRELSVPVTDPGGSHELFLVFANNAGDTSLFNVDWVRFSSPLVEPLGTAYKGIRELDAAIEANKAKLSADQYTYLTGLSDRIDRELLTAWSADPNGAPFQKAAEKALLTIDEGLLWLSAQRNLDPAVKAALQTPLEKASVSTSSTVTQLRKVTVSTTSAKPDVVAGTTARVTTTIRNAGTTTVQAAEQSLTVPAGWTAKAVSPVATQQIAPGASFATQWDVTVPVSAKLGANTLTGKGMYQNTGLSRVVVPAPLSLQVKPEVSADTLTVPQPFLGGTPTETKVKVTNNRSTPVTVTATVKAPAGWTATPAQASVPAGQTVDVPVAVTAPAGTPVKGNLTMDTLTAEVTATGVTVAGAPTATTYRVPGPDDSVLVLDGGSTTSPVLAGYTRLSPADAWDPAKGFGWTTTGVDFRDRGAPDALRRDFTLSRNPHVLRVQIPAGQHVVSLLRGDNSFSSGATQVELDGQVVVPPGGTLPTGQYAWEQFTVDGGATGRTADLRISNNAGDYWRLLALTVQAA